MTIDTSHAYDAGIDALYEMLTDEAFLRAKYEGVGSRNVEFESCEQDGDVFRIEWTREIPSNPPAFAKKILGEWNRTEEIMEWTRESDGGARADYLCKVAGVPGKLEGEFELLPDGDGCVEEIVMKASISIPLIGGKIASFVEADAESNLGKEYAFTRTHLGED
jgi:hypothetical protein